MKKFAYIALSVLLTACSAANKENMAPAPEAVEEVMEKNVATVQFNDELTALVEEALAAGGLVTKSAPLNSALEELGIVGLRRVFPDAGEFEPRTRREGLHRFYRAEEMGYPKAAAAVRALVGSK